MNKDENKSIACLTISDLRELIKECLREYDQEKYRDATNAVLEEKYKQLWIKPTVVTEDGFKCDG